MRLIILTNSLAGFTGVCGDHSFRDESIATVRRNMGVKHPEGHSL